MIVFVFAQNTASACTNYLITKGASADGSTMISYSADSHVLYGELYHWAAATYPKGTMMDIYEWDTGEFLGKILQAERTYTVNGNMNQFQVAIGETTFGGRDELAAGPGTIMDYGSLIYISLQRARTAREAIRTMIQLVDDYGYYSSGESFSFADKNEVWIMEMIGKGKTIRIDKNKFKELEKAGVPANMLKSLKRLTDKTWYSDKDFTDMLTSITGRENAAKHGKTLIKAFESGQKGALWVAMKVPDGYVSSHANQARITTFPLEDLKTSFSSNNLDKINNPDISVIYAADVISFARERGYITDKVADNEFSFSDTYAPVEFSSARFCEIRVWSMFNKVIDNGADYWDYAKGHITHDERTGYANNRMPLWVKPNRKITVRDMMDFMRDHLEGTELDMSKDMGAGPYGVPYRWRPLTWKVDGVSYLNERATATQQTGFVFVSQSRSWLPDEVGGILWFGVDDAASSVFYPQYSSATKVPELFARGYGSMMEFVDDAAFWVFNQVTNLAYTRYSDIHPEIRQKIDILENAYINKTADIDKKALELYQQHPNKAVEYLTNYSVQTGNDLVKDWKKFYGHLFTRFMDGNIKEKDGDKQNPKVSQPGYSETWKRAVIQETGEKLKVKGSDGH